MNHPCEIENKLLIATTIVAGTNNTNRAPRVEETIFPSSQFKNSIFLTPAEPAKLTITSETEDIMNLFISLGDTPIKPITNPNTNRSPSKKGLRFPNRALSIPPISASTTPIKNAHALTIFSLDLIAISVYRVNKCYE